MGDFSHLVKLVGEGSAKLASRILVNDGPLRQPLLDYMMQTGSNEHYDTQGTENPEQVTGLGKHMSFARPGGPDDDRLQAMKDATAQANFRRMLSVPPARRTRNW